MKKRVIGALLCVAMVASLVVGCGNQVGSSSSADESTAAEESTAADESAEEASAEDEEAAWKEEPAYGTTITIGYDGGACLGGLGIAQAKGFYEEQGLDVEIISVDSASDAVGTGKVVAAGDHIATLLVPAVNGVNITFTTASQTGCKSLYVLADSDIETTEDLVGKTVAVPDGIGNSDQNITMRYFNHDGIDPQSVNYKVVSSDALVQALKDGEVQAANLSDGFAQPLVEDGTLRYIRSITYDEDFQKEPCCILGINSDFLAENPITAKKITQAFSDANDWIEANKDEAADVLLENSWASGEKEDVVALLESWNFGITDEETEVALRDVIEDYKTFGLFDEDIDTEETLDKVWEPLLLQ